MYFTYILESISSGRLYIGQTNNIDDRLRRHNLGHNKSTRGRGPWKLLHSKQFSTRSEAMFLERKLKSFKNPEKVMDWIIQNP